MFLQFLHDFPGGLQFQCTRYLEYAINILCNLYSNNVHTRYLYIMYYILFIIMYIIKFIIYDI